eukprot:CAMPEP_0172852638 /NCGR_PEP_ID=MMETSP1075-20121228/54414_1 /TAXON_ID=2916 /ORGANISM="Ceratium fusus, Strain PA161109" /LENGTH=45 /DNA_ID= /DNA_START= /DNA_END= /DNA_ORIENTATION=
MAWRILTVSCLVPVAAKPVQIVTFDGKPETTWQWKTMNDPVMGGV